MIDKVVVLVTIGCGIFIAGVGIGEHQTKQALKTTCTPQASEYLTATHQTADGVICQYAQNNTGRYPTRRNAE